MKIRSLLPLFLSLALLGLSAGCARSEAPAPAKTASAGSLLPARTAATTDWLDRAIAAYPLQTCSVSGDKLGSMGASQDFVWSVAGQPDRLVRFCCADCRPDFEKDPAKFLALIDAGAKK
jgi:hypothetical protein